MFLCRQGRALVCRYCCQPGGVCGLDQHSKPTALGDGWTEQAGDSRAHSDAQNISEGLQVWETSGVPKGPHGSLCCATDTGNPPRSPPPGSYPMAVSCLS